MKLIILIISYYGYSFTINKAIQFEWCSCGSDLLHKLLHLTICQRIIIKSVNSPIILVKDLSPVLYEIFLSRIFYYLRIPALMRQQFDKRFFKFTFLIK